MTLRRTLISAGLALATVASIAAASPQTAPNVTALERAQGRLDRLAGQTKGGPQHKLLLEKQRLHQLIDDLDAGKVVDPGEIDRALQRAENPWH